ncbi:hypothetical protein [Halorarum salinum]|uniref:Apea-like HEPN domain-containing protein n=1 Tax=Halorarum salinum TaxID=2743089 RepID=A0A7D5LA84_9EURY|nr:hypothetical protein [Halobaculum salinum]QLG61986.1 hypothetical protein HUG12_09735 [Halobaculum salinum]
MTSSPDQGGNLSPAFYEFIDHAAAQIEAVGIPENVIHRVEPTELAFTQKTDSRPDIEQALRKASLQSTDPTESFQTAIEDQYDLRLSGYMVYQLLHDVFGEEGEYLTSYDDRAAAVLDSLKQDLERGTPEYVHNFYLTGIELSDGPIEITDSIEIGHPTEEELTYEVSGFANVLPGMQSETRPSEIRDSVIIRYHSTQHPNLSQSTNPVHDVLLPALRLVDRGNASYIYQENIPQGYLGQRGTGRPISSASPLPKVEIESDDESRLQNLFTLLHSEIDGDTKDFHYPLSAAIDHYETSLEKRTYTRESVTFAVIGLEAMYGGRKGTVTAYCPLLLGLLDDQYDPLEVRKTLKQGYDEYRNKWAHGGRRNRSGKDIQEEIWDYLRASIVGFCLLHEGDTLTKGTRNTLCSLLEKATIEDEAREELKQRTESMHLSEYIK